MYVNLTRKLSNVDMDKGKEQEIYTMEILYLLFTSPIALWEL